MVPRGLYCRVRSAGSRGSPAYCLCLFVRVPTSNLDALSVETEETELLKPILTGVTLGDVMQKNNSSTLAGLTRVVLEVVEEL